MHCGEKLLQAFETLLAFDAKQLVPMSLSCLKPPAGDQRGILSNIFLVDQLKARLLDQLLINSRRYEKK